jgi:2-hydroxychromene-2-carboxylate isomerase
MAPPLAFSFDFASPCAYFALDRVERLAQAHGRAVIWRSMLLWAALNAQGALSPMQPPAKRAYFLDDIARSAAFLGVVYRAPSRFPLSSHRAARLFYGLGDGPTARAIGRDVFKAYFAADADFSDAETLVEIAGRHGVAGLRQLAWRLSGGPISDQM